MKIPKNDTSGYTHIGVDKKQRGGEIFLLLFFVNSKTFANFAVANNRESFTPLSVGHRSAILQGFFHALLK
nr:MAG TPA: hypothetical protein [Caudoviricetes sp.]